MISDGKVLEIRTSIGDLARIPSRTSVSEFGKCRANLAQALICCSVSWPLVFRQRDLLFFARLGIYDGGDNRNDFVIEPAGLLSPFSPLIRFSCKSILRFPGDVKVVSNIFRSLAHRLQAVSRFRVLKDFIVKGINTGAGDARH